MDRGEDGKLFQFMTTSSRPKGQDDGKEPSPAVYSCTHVLGDKMKSYCNNPEFSDVIIKIGTQQYYAHGFLLSSWSDSLKTKLAEAKLSPTSSSSTNVTLQLESPPKMHKHVIDQFISFLYTGKIKFWEIKDAENVIAVAKKYDIKVLANLCEDYMVNCLEENDLEKAMSTFYQAEELQLENLIKKCKFVLGVNFENIPLLFWKELSKEVVCEMIDSSFLVVENESIILDKLMLWVTGLEEEQKMQCLKEMIPKIRFVHMSSRELQDVENSEYGTLIKQVNPNAFQDAFESRSLIAEAVEVRRQETFTTTGTKVVKPVEILKETDTIPPPRIYWHFHEPGCKVTNNKFTANLTYLMNKTSVTVVFKERGIWKCVNYPNWELLGKFDEKKDEEWFVSLELIPNLLHQTYKYAVAITMIPENETLQVVSGICCHLGMVKKTMETALKSPVEVIKMRLGTGLVGEEKPSSIKLHVAIYVWKV